MPGHPVVTAYAGPESTAAVRLGVTLAGALHAPLVLASAYAYEPVALSARALPATANVVAFDTAQARLHGARLLVPADVDVQERVLPAGSVSEALVNLTREVDATLVVTGPDEDGHVARAILEHAACPVAVARPRLSSGAPLRVIAVAYDGSVPADRAVTAAMHLAVLAGARVTLLAVRPPGTPPDTAVDAAAHTIAEYVSVGVAHLFGPPGEALAEAARAFDLLVCGSHGRGRLGARILGSVSGQLVAEALCPVLVVPARVRHQATQPLGLTTAAG